MTARELLEKRWVRIWDALEAHDLDGLYVAGKGHILGYGPFHYLSGYQHVLRYAGALIRPQCEPVLLLTTDAEARLVRQRTGIADVRCTSRPARTALDLMRSAHGPDFRLGVHDAEQYLTVPDYLALQSAEAPAMTVDATRLFQAVKTRKFPEEIAGIERTFRIAEEGFETAIAGLRPGGTGWQIAAEVERVIRRRGVPDSLIFIGAGEHFLHWPDDRPLASGDLVTCFVEIIGPEGYWVECGGMFSMGAPAAAPRHLAQACLHAFADGAAALRPGATTRTVCAAVEAVAARNALHSGIWHGHGIGVDHDTPFLVASDDTVLEEDMVVALHPNFSDPAHELSASLADCFHVTADGPRRLSRFPPRLRVID